MNGWDLSSTTNRGAAIKFNLLDTGGVHAHPNPNVGQAMGQAAVLGGRTVVYPNGSRTYTHSIMFWAKSWQAIGGQTALSKGAALYLGHQLEELAQNPDLQPVFIQWTATDEGGGVLNAADPHDGWYVISDLHVDYHNAATNGYLQVTASVALTASPPPASQAMWYSGGSLPSNFSAAPQTVVGYPLNAANQVSTAANRTGGEGLIPITTGPPASTNPLVFTPSATIADWFKCGCHVYDTVNTGSNPVPAAPTFANANWVEVFNTDHRYEGDCFITNGLLGILLIAGQARVCRFYVWSTAQASAGWVQAPDFNYNDNASNAGSLRSYTLTRLGGEDVRLTARASTSTGNLAEFVIRLQRGMYFARVDFRPLTQAAALSQALSLAFPAVPKITYNSAKIADVVLGESSPAVQTDYGYGAAFIASTANPYLAGWLYQNQPAVQPGSPNNTVNISWGDSTSLAQLAMRSVGIFVVPSGTSATTTTDRLQGEGEGGAFDTGWSSVVDAGSSGGSAAKGAANAAVNTKVTFGSLTTLQAGTFDLWMRVRVTSTGGTGNWIFGLTENGGSITFSGGALAPSSFTTSYAWYRVYTGYAADGAKTQQFRVQVNSQSNTDVFVDEAVWAPKTISNIGTGPQDLSQQFLHDRTTRIVRP